MKKIKLIMMSIICLPVFIWAVMIVCGKVPFIDQLTPIFTEKLDQTTLYYIARWITELGSKTFLIPFTCVMALVLWRMYNHLLPAILFAGGTLMSHLLNQLIKSMIQRERPSIFVEASATGYSFPSGHAMISIVCYGLLLFFLTRKLSHKLVIRMIKIGLILLILFIGLSRFIINVHYLTDIYSGFVIGFILLVSICKLYTYLNLKGFKYNMNQSLD